MSRIIGIDLGTTTSIMTYMENDEPQIIEVSQEIASDGKIIPSVISINEDGSTTIGKTAKNQIVRYPDRVVSEVKRLFGSDKVVNIGENEFQPYEISAILLSHLKKLAEKHLNEKVDEAVITVPANFNNIQRELTKKAGELAGIQVKRIINEPTAAALAYGFNNSGKEEKILVYDLGGGTFDVTILEIIGDVVDVICSRGNNSLGGKDFDTLLQRHVINDFYNKYGINLHESCEKRVLQNIKENVEEAKKQLSIQNSANIYVPYVSFKDNMPLSIDIDISRKEFESLIMDLVLSTQDTVEEALKAGNLEAEDIDSVILVGGSSRVPLVKEILNMKFSGRVKDDINPDLAVAIGACIQGEIKSSNSEISLIVTDKCSHNLGIAVRKNIDGEVRSDIFSKIIEKDCSVPCSKRKVYTTVCDNQDKVIIPIYEGDSEIVSENIKIGQVVLDGIPPGKKGSQDILVDFKYDINGIINVTATIKSTNKNINTTIDFGKSIKPTSTEISEKDDGIVVKVNEDKSDYTKEELYMSVKNSMEFAKNISDESQDIKYKDKVESKLNEMKDAILKNDKDKLQQLDIELTDIMFEI